MYKRVYPREKYLSKIRPFFDSDIIKVITGIRRCGKSFLLKGIINELLEKGVSEKQIIYIPLVFQKLLNFQMLVQGSFTQEELSGRYLIKM